MATTQLTVKSQSSGAGYSAENTTSWSHTDPQRFLETHDVAAAATITVRWDNVTAASKTLIIICSDTCDISIPAFATGGQVLTTLEIKKLLLDSTDANEATITNNTAGAVTVELEVYG